MAQAPGGLPCAFLCRQRELKALVGRMLEPVQGLGGLSGSVLRPGLHLGHDPVVLQSPDGEQHRRWPLSPFVRRGTEHAWRASVRAEDAGALGRSGR